MEKGEEDKTLERLAEFHGHLGPYVVVGYRMGQVANREISEDPFEKEAVAFTGRNPPVSCIVDGVQFSSGCTLGKGNVEIDGDQEPSVEFSGNGTSLKTTLKKEVRELISGADEDELEDLSGRLLRMPEDELLVVEETRIQEP